MRFARETARAGSGGGDERMADLFDYLAWRGDVTLTADPLNEVDNLILTELAYADFSGIVTPEGGSVSLEDACRLFFEKHPEEKVREDKTFMGKAPLLMKAMLSGPRFSGARLRRYIDEIDREKDLQLSAVTYLLPDGSAYVAFRGTDNTLVGWKEDFNFSFLSQTEGQTRAARYLNEVAAAVPGPLRVGGHSKGGNLAVYAAAFCEEKVQERIMAVYSNDGPGFRQEILETEGYARILPRIVSIIPDTSVIGLLLASKSCHRVVKSSAFGIMQHDGFTWQVRRNRFEGASLSAAGRAVHEALGGWLEQMDDEERRHFTDTVFSLFEATGKDTFSGIGDQKWKSAEAILAYAAGIPRERQQEVLSALAKLGQSGGSAAAAFLQSRIGKINLLDKKPGTAPAPKQPDAEPFSS